RRCGAPGGDASGQRAYADPESDPVAQLAALDQLAAAINTQHALLEQGLKRPTPEARPTRGDRPGGRAPASGERGFPLVRAPSSRSSQTSREPARPSRVDHVGKLSCVEVAEEVLDLLRRVRAR